MDFSDSDGTEKIVHTTIDWYFSLLYLSSPLKSGFDCDVEHGNPPKTPVEDTRIVVF